MYQQAYLFLQPGNRIFLFRDNTQPPGAHRRRLPRMKCSCVFHLRGIVQQSSSWSRQFSLYSYVLPCRLLPQENMRPAVQAYAQLQQHKFCTCLPVRFLDGNKGWGYKFRSALLHSVWNFLLQPERVCRQCEGISFPKF